MLNEKIPLPEICVRTEEVDRELDAMILSGSVVCMKDSIYYPAAFAQEDETASRTARLPAEERPPMKDIPAAIVLLKESFNPKAVLKLMGDAKEIITMDVYADNRGISIIADGVPEIEEHVKEVL